MAFLLVGIDTEGDNQWDAAARERQTFHNLYALPTLHALFAQHGVRPTYVITHPVACNPRSADVLRTLKAGGDCEIGAHHHAWETPPCTAADVRRHPYASVLPIEQFESQLRSLTEVITAATGDRPVSYRSGRFGFSAAHVSGLERAGYLVDSSVAPLFYESHKGGPEFVEAPLSPYLLAYDSATGPGSSQVIELPISCALNRRVPAWLAHAYARAPRPYTTKRVLRKLGVARVQWLRPSYSSLDDMKALARRLTDAGEPLLNLLFHSSEAIVGGSPYNRTQSELDGFLDRLDRFFTYATGDLKATPVTFREFRDRFTGASSNPSIPQSIPPIPNPQSTINPTIPNPQSPMSYTMHVCHITAHVPPDQAANALLPWHLGVWAAQHGHEVSYVAHRPRSLAQTGPVPQGPALPGRIAWAPDNRGYGTILRRTRMASLLASRAIARVVRPSVGRADVVHVHGNGLLAEMGARVAGQARKPVVLTLYGTEIWHYRPRRFIDLFTRAYRRAGAVTFYSRGLLERARELGLARDGMTVIYPPVAPHFTRLSEPDRAALRQKLGLSAANVLVNVKRLHPLAGHRFFLEAMPQVLRSHPDTHVVICGSGPLHEELEQLASRLRIANRVTFTGLLENARVAEYCAAADAFVLPSLLEALPTVAVEALACGTRVVSADHPGGVELHGLFGDDVRVVPRRDISALASAIEGVLTDRRRAAPESDACLLREFHPTAVWSRYEAVYEECLRDAPDR